MTGIGDELVKLWSDELSFWTGLLKRHGARVPDARPDWERNRSWAEKRLLQTMHAAGL